MLGPEHLDVATSLNNLAGLYEAQERYGDAEGALYRDAFSDVEAAARGEASHCRHHPQQHRQRLYDSLGDRQQALTYYRQALPIAAGGRRPGRPEATTLNNIGRVYNSLGDRQQALTYYQQALPITREVGDRAG